MLPRLTITLLLTFALTPAIAQRPHADNTPGRFDFYLMEASWSPEFCFIHDTSPQCKAKPGFILHGLWPQNNDGTWPEFCSHEPAPADINNNLDITPDRTLLHHEWDKHGTCSAIGPQRFFAAEHQAFHALHIPATLEHVDHELRLTPQQILGDFYAANPDFPQGSILLSCGHNYLTAIHACFSKDLHPIACQNIPTCHANVVKIAPPGETSNRRRDN